MEGETPRRVRDGMRGGRRLESAILGGTAAVEPPAENAKAVVETADLTARQASSEARDPRNTVGRVMPVALIAPSAMGMDPVAKALADKRSWGIARLGAEKSAYSGKDVRVAVLDTGIAKGHPAFAGVEWTAQNFTGGPVDDVTDENGHGTHCAGTIFGRDVDGVRIGV